MKKKNFDDFMSTLTSDKIKSLTNNLPSEIERSDISGMLTKSAAISYSLSTELLRLYHD